VSIRPRSDANARRAAAGSKAPAAAWRTMVYLEGPAQLVRFHGTNTTIPPRKSVATGRDYLGINPRFAPFVEELAPGTPLPDATLPLLPNCDPFVTVPNVLVAGSAATTNVELLRAHLSTIVLHTGATGLGRRGISKERMALMFKRKLLSGLFAGAMLLTTALPAAAQDRLAFTFVNKSGWVVSGLYVDPSSQKNWGENILSAPMDVDGGSVDVTFSGYGTTCVFDIAAEFTDGSWWYNDQFNLCSISKVTLNPDNKWSWE
jgi:hypothetical protein